MCVLFIFFSKKKHLFRDQIRREREPRELIRDPNRAPFRSDRAPVGSNCIAQRQYTGPLPSHPPAPRVGPLVGGPDKVRW